MMTLYYWIESKKTVSEERNQMCIFVNYEVLCAMSMAL